VVIKSVEEDRNFYLKGHENIIVMLTVSNTGRMIASGERGSGGAPAAVIIWDFDSREIIYRVRYHIDLIQALTFNCDEVYLCSLGGQADGNKIVMWNMLEGGSEALQAASN
jgi:WD40 repeat protein